MGFKDNAEGKKKVSLMEQKLQEAQELTDDIDWDNVTLDLDTYDKLVFFIYGDKNDGKTVLAYSLMEDGDTALVISLDKQSHHAIKEIPHLREKIDNGTIKIEVINASVYYNKTDSATMLVTAMKTYNYIVGILDRYMDPKNEKYKIDGKKPTWVIIDGTERLNNILEMTMRKNNGIRPYDGISNFNLWKERNQYIDNIHEKSLDLSEKGVIYTSYIVVKEIINSATVVKSKEIPKWIGQIMEETNIQIKAEADRDGRTEKYYAHVISKRPSRYPNGKFDVTNRTLREAVEHGYDGEMSG